MPYKFKSTAAAIDRDLRNCRTDDENERAALDGALAIVGRQTFSSEAEISVTLEASDDEISVTVAAA